MSDRLPTGVEIKAEITPEYAEILTHGALALVARLHRSFEHRRQELLETREQVAKRFDLGLRPDFLKYTASIREADWKIGKLPKGSNTKSSKMRAERKVWSMPPRYAARHALPPG